MTSYDKLIAGFHQRTKFWLHGLQDRLPVSQTLDPLPLFHHLTLSLPSLRNWMLFKWARLSTWLTYHCCWSLSQCSLLSIVKISFRSPSPGRRCLFQRLFFFLSPVSDTKSSGKKLRNTATLPLSNPPSTWDFPLEPRLVSPSNPIDQRSNKSLAHHPIFIGQISPENSAVSTAILPSSDKRCVGKQSAVQTSPRPREASNPLGETVGAKHASSWHKPYCEKMWTETIWSLMYMTWYGMTWCECDIMWLEHVFSLIFNTIINTYSTWYSIWVSMIFNLIFNKIHRHPEFFMVQSLSTTSWCLESGAAAFVWSHGIGRGSRPPVGHHQYLPKRLTWTWQKS